MNSGHTYSIMCRETTISSLLMTYSSTILTRELPFSLPSGRPWPFSVERGILMTTTSPIRNGNRSLYIAISPFGERVFVLSLVWDMIYPCLKMKSLKARGFYLWWQPILMLCIFFFKLEVTFRSMLTIVWFEYIGFFSSSWRDCHGISWRTKLSSINHTMEEKKKYLTHLQ